MTTSLSKFAHSITSTAVSALPIEPLQAFKGLLCLQELNSCDPKKGKMEAKRLSEGPELSRPDEMGILLKGD